MNTLLLDIDYTTFHQRTPRPYLKEFIERMAKTHTIGFYTAADIWRLKEVCRLLESEFGFSTETAHKMYRNSLSRERCPMIRYDKPDGTSIEIKCLQKAADCLRVSVEDITLLDDMPMHDNPHVSQRIQVPGFWGQTDDVFLRDLQLSH